jgi:transcriptional regulator with XRE-family HTH domain|tara:strand:+ start:172 stop:501 length:330 start_codon:yes stop_codon:yes gene_type:complete
LTIGNRVKEARKKAGMTQEMLARLSGVPQARISALELNKNKKSSYLIQLSNALGVNPNWLETGVADLSVEVEYSAMEKELLRLIKGLSEEDRAREISYIQKLVSARSNL